jgi:propanol-preferring alcohol dehydrogenase
MFGDRQDAVEALEFVARGQVKAPIEIYCLEDLNDIFDKMEKGQITGRAVIDLWK